MNRNTILLLGAGLFSGLILWDRANSTDMVIAATVLSVEDRDPGKGPDTWHITVQTEIGPIALEPRSDRPDLSPGDKICVTVARRMARDDSYFLAPASASC